QRLNDLIAEDRISGQRSNAGGGGGVTTGLADAFHQTFSTDFRQIVCSVSGAVGWYFPSRDVGYFPGQIGDGKAGGFGGQCDDRGYHLPHPDFVQIDSRSALGSPLSRRRQGIERSLNQERNMSRSDDVEKIVQIRVHGS